jgi:lipid A 3-O-deacylase
VKKRVFGLVCLLFSGSACLAQRVQWQAFRLTEENDFLNLTQRGLDRYYTQGLRFEFLYATTKRSFTEKILIPVSAVSQNQYAVSVSQQIYTPRQIDVDPETFAGNDMPYAGNFYLSHKLNSYDSAKRLRFVSRLDAGVIGPIALGENTQAFFHRIIQNNPAVGWDTQMRNDILLNYSFRIEKQMARWGLLSTDAIAEANVGTLQVSAVAGINLRLGTWKQNNNFVWEIFFWPEGRAVAYNALLQGGVFNRMAGDPAYTQYFLDAIKPLVYSHSTGFQVRYTRWELLYRQVNITREFSKQLPHYYGSVTLTFWFRKGFPPRG